MLWAMGSSAALVSGANGFIGRALVGALLSGGWAVRAVGRRPRPGWMPADVDYRTVDLAGDDDLQGLIGSITHVFHLAGASSSLSSPEEMHRSNVIATERLVASLAGSDVERLVYLSSTSVYGEEEPLDIPVREDVDPRPSRGYGKAKWKAEQAVWAAGAAGLPVVVLRPASVFGPRNVKLLGSVVLDIAIEHFVGMRDLVVGAEPVELRLLPLDDVVRASLHLARHGGAIGRAFNMVFPEYPTNHRIIEILAPLFGMTPTLRENLEPPLSYDQRAASRTKMLELGMEPDILLTEERFLLLGKHNINNRLSIDALLSTGFTFQDEALDGPIERAVDWYMENRWILL